MDILTILEYDDVPLKRGFYEDGEHDFNQSITAGHVKLDLTVYQQRYTGNQRSFPDSPPEADVYATDVTRVVINQITYLPAHYEMYDLDFEIRPKDFKQDAIKNSLSILFQNYSDDDNDDYTKEYKQLVLPHLMSDLDVISSKLLQFISSVEHEQL